MARRRRTPEAVEEVSEGFVQRETDEVESAPERITISLNADGSVNWDQTPREFASKIIDTVSKDADLLEELSKNPEFADGPSDDASKWQPAEAGFALDLLDRIEAVVLTGISKKVLGMKIEAKHSMAAFVTTEDEHKIQDPRAAQALNDFLTIEDQKWRNLSLLIAAHGAATIRKVKEAIKAQMEAGPVPESDVVKPNGKGTHVTTIEGVAA
jgi:hypothetical protein